MSGLEKIIQKIELDCKTECDGIIANAEAEAKEILDSASREAELIGAEIVDAAMKENEKELAFVNSKAELDRKKGILAVKIDIVNSVIKTALSKLKELPDEEYFEKITALVLKYAQNGSGTLCFSKRDLGRIPAGYELCLNGKLSDGFSLKISSEPVDIDGGFILVYGDVEQNCSFDALLASSTDEIKDELYGLLFKRDGV